MFFDAEFYRPPKLAVKLLRMYRDRTFITSLEEFFASLGSIRAGLERLLPSRLFRLP